MPLLDHFHPPHENRAPWSSIGTMWVASLVKSLNRTLPRDRFRAFAKAHLSSTAEADVAEYELESPATTSDGGTALAIQPALFTLEAQFPDEFEVQVHEYRDTMRLSAVIELVSPGIKDRETERRRFTSKCAAYLSLGVGVVLVDVVTSRRVNFHNLLMEELGGARFPLPPEIVSYVAAYKPNPWNPSSIEVWPYSAPVGKPIPSLPLPLRDGPSVALDLEGTYCEAITDNGF